MLDEPITSYTEALGFIRERLGTVLKIRYEDFDHLCDFSPGMAGKVFGPSMVKRLGIEKFFDAIRGAGLRIRFEEDPEQTARMLERIAENYNPRQENQARPNNHALPSNKLVESILNYLANKKGGLSLLNAAVKMAHSNQAAEGGKHEGVRAVLSILPDIWKTPRGLQRSNCRRKPTVRQRRNRISGLSSKANAGARANMDDLCSRSTLEIADIAAERARRGPADHQDGRSRPRIL